MHFDILFKSAHDIMKRAESVLIVAHKKPDGDTVGATAALRRWFRQEGIAVTNFCLDAVPPQYLYMRGTEKYVSDPAVFDGDHDILVVVDCSDLRYAGIHEQAAKMTAPSRKRRPVLINIDHHVTNEMFGDLNLVDAHASSACELMHRFFEHVGADVNQDMATCLLTGIITDTGHFSNPATTRSSLEAASRLLQLGAKAHDVSRNLQRNKSVPSLRLWGAVLSRLKYNDRLGVASTVIFSSDLGDGVTEEHVEGVSNFLNQFLDAKVIMVLREMPDGQVRGSLRSAEQVDVSQIAKLMGGGGHKKAAGFAVPGRIVEDATGWRVEG
jgi:phosphoesterase RecJ-like protein